MLYFRVLMGSEYYCGFDCYGYFKAEKEVDMYKQEEYQNFRDEMQDYVSGDLSEDDYEEYEDADAISEVIDEITEEEYLEGIGYNSIESPYHVG